VIELHTQLHDWLFQSGYPLWLSRGVDERSGGFQEGLSQEGTPLPVPWRARVQARQIFAFSQLGALSTAVRGMEYFQAHYRRPDGLFRTLAEDDRALLYDQAFALLALASLHETVGGGSRFERDAESLWGALTKYLGRPGALGFDSDDSRPDARLSNPHMHLFEATIAWSRVGGDAWRGRADELGELALTRLIDPSGGFIREHYDTDWIPLDRMVEPGHQFEWGSLLLLWGGGGRSAALRLIEFAEAAGVRHGIALNALLDDGSVHDANARLWPQTERLRAGALAARVTGDARYSGIARSAAVTLLSYLDTPVKGLWHDLLLPSGEFQNVPANAGTLYHIIGAVNEFGRFMATGARHE
jgi:mannose-6-phosphate isomerase